ncbi:non-ribosomal peptide synthetase [Actinoplanes derwentensis]|uniref:Amino acid adenylation domain-containing protein n=1 Tax=Actinoplanes derwentensis TaxID=113562 RepID=A0A1H2CIW3_9ACTN|nr:non-ribosomal peptide synthetase [Actinoplanes derwentensis]GID89584.1 hypothetical protein Ade03nite_85080 [Actinoplanes derwentensis]SDT70192.1 amino acid adenylation domain-containing protein [Actinoplanes derwentensis]
MTSVVGASPTSAAQQRIWFVEQLVPGTALHHRHAAFDVPGELDLPALERAVNGAIDRHEVLRTRFRNDDGTPVQEVLAEAPVTVRRVDGRVAEFLHEPFDLTGTPLVRAGLVHGADGTTTLVFVLHAIVADAGSMAVFLREVAGQYRRSVQEPPIRFADHAARQREWIRTPEAVELREARVTRLAGFPTVLDLPADRSRPAVQTFAGESLTWHVPSSLARRLDQVSDEHGTTLRTLLLAAFSVVLGVWSRQERLLVGTPAAGTTPLIGPVTDTLVIPADMTGAPSFAAYLERMHHAYRDAGSVAFEELIDGLAPERSLSHHPLIQTMVTVHDGSALRLELPDAELRPVETTVAAAFDLMLDAGPDAGGLACRLWYSADLFERDTADRFRRHLQRLLDIVGENPAVGIDGIDLTDAEERALLAEFGTGPARLVDPRALPTRLIEAARLRPDAVAVRAPDGVHTFAALIERATSIGAELVAHGLRPGDLAGVALPRGRDLPAGLLGVWLAGGAYVPLDPAYPRARLEHMTQDAGIKVLLSTRDLVDRVPVPADTRILLVDELESRSVAGPPLPTVDGADVAYVIYTSGSTGRPKGVLVQHTSLGNLLDDFAYETSFGDGDRLLALTSLSFDIAGLELWLPLLTGGTLVIGPPGIGGDPEQLHELLAAENITVVQATPATWKLYTSNTRAAPAGLRQIWSGGEHLPHPLARALTALGPEVHNVYGPTETTIWSTRAVLGRHDTATGIGRPLANTSLFVTGDTGHRVPLGVPGELCIGGAGLALGYLDRPELTAERFTDVGGVPVYRTGDLVRWHPDGHLEYLGRLDDQVKIRGHRVEPGEVDAVAQTVPGVRDVCTLVVTAGSGESQLVTFVTPAAGDLKHSTRAVLRRALPDYMVPSRVLTLPELPLTPNGKTDRTALKSIARQLASDTDHVPPGDPTQVLLHEIWCGVLDVPRVSVTENIFDVGVTSLLIVRIRQELRDRHGIDVPLTAFFTYPTISALAQSLRTAAEPSERQPAAERAPSTRTRNATAGRRRNRREEQPPEQQLEQQLEFWRRRLAGSDRLELPVDRTRPPVRSTAGDTVEFTVPAKTLRALHDLVQRERITPHIALLTVFQALLAGHTGQDDIAVGTPAPGRTGSRANTVVVRGDLSGDPTVHELFARIRDRVVEAFEHQDVPFDQVTDALVPAPDPADTPLFRASFALRDGVPRPVAEVDLAMTARIAGDTLDVRLTYATALFDRATVQRMAGHFQTLLSGAVADPGTRLSEWEMLSPAERHRILVEFNNTGAEFPRDTPVHELIEERVAAAPGLPAVASGELTLSYGELNDRANRLAHHLRGLGVGPGTMVGICLRRGVHTVVAPLAILKAGGAYVPLDPDYPAERLSFMLDDTAAPIVVTDSALADRLSGGERSLVRLDTDRDAVAAHSPVNPGPGAGATDLAYVLYTSGSTGMPKGVRITHRNLVNLLVAVDGNYSIARGEALLSVTATTFDISAVELLLPLLSHATVVIAEVAQVTSPGGLGELVERHGVRHVQGTPSLWRLILDAAPDALRGVRVYAAGEALPVDLAERLAARSAGVTNLYGPTETTIYSTMTALLGGRPAGSSVPIGRPIANTVTYVVDRHGRPVPVGVAGELLIGGEGVSPGYLNRPELTAERFVDSMVAGGPAVRVYRTGDLVRWLPNGDLDFLGRTDHQVKLRGFRIELGEIEAVLAAHDSVGSCAVLVREDVPGERRLVAYTTAALSGSELRAFVRQRLPEYMVPEVFVLLTDMPLTTSGKVDRRALPAPEQGRPDTGSAFVAPRDELEEAVAEVWAQVLGIERIGAHDDFFELGGQSVKAIQVINRLGALTGLALSLNALFTTPTVATLTARIVAEFAAEEAEPAG